MKTHKETAIFELVETLKDLHTKLSGAPEPVELFVGNDMYGATVDDIREAQKAIFKIEVAFDNFCQVMDNMRILADYRSKNPDCCKAGFAMPDDIWALIEDNLSRRNF